MKRSVGAPMNAPMNVKDLKRLGGGRDADRLAASAAAALADSAADAGLLDVAVGEIDSPVGDLLLAVTPRGLAYVAFEDEERDDLLARLSRQLSPRILEHPAATDEVRRQLDEYFAGDRKRFELKLDRRLMRGIARDVLAATARVPFGRTDHLRDARRAHRPAARLPCGRQRPGLQPDPDRGAVPPGPPRRRRRGRVRRRPVAEAPAADPRRVAPADARVSFPANPPRPRLHGSRDTRR